MKLMSVGAPVLIGVSRQEVPKNHVCSIYDSSPLYAQNPGRPVLFGHQLLEIVARMLALIVERINSVPGLVSVTASVQDGWCAIRYRHRGNAQIESWIARDNRRFIDKPFVT